jgi:DnaK suppressor protein
MNPKERIEIKEQIRINIRKLEKDIRTLKELTLPIAPDCAIGRVSHMDAINNKSVNEAALRKKEVQLKSLKDTIKKLDNTNFGKCIRCGQTIQLGRIMMMPESKKCVRCAGR